MRERLIVMLVLFPIGLYAIIAGGWAYTTFILSVLVLAAFEYSGMFHIGKYQPITLLVVWSVATFVVARSQFQFSHDPLILGFFILLSMLAHMVAFERGRDTAGIDFLVTLGGILYLGYIGGFLINIRTLPDGLWWYLIVMPSVWWADMAAYVFGSKFGRTPLVPRLSPKKTWEGYFGGVFSSIIMMQLMLLLYQKIGMQVEEINWFSTLLISIVMSVFATLGDFGVSMLKRQAGVKDSGKLLLGHGGFFDRADSSLWAATIGFLMITYFFV